jgi:hypothetical protein
MSALDTVTGSFNQFDSNNVWSMEPTLSTDLPPNVNYDVYDYQGQSTIPYQGTSEIPAVTETPRSDSGISVSGFLGGLSATVKSGLDVWKSVNNINMSARTQQANNQIDLLKLDVAKQQALGQLELNRAQIDSNKQVGLIQARSSVDQATRAAVDARGGTFTSAVSSVNWPVLLGLAGLVYAVSQGKGKKA